MILLVESAIKVAIIVLVALACLPLLRKRPAALRHWLLAAAIVCGATAPVVSLAIPAWRLPVAADVDRAAS